MSGTVAAESLGYILQPTVSESHIVFVAEDNLWLVGHEGGIPRRLTSHGGRHPLLSTSGNLVAFVLASDVWVLEVRTARTRRLTWFGGGSARPVAWVPAGRGASPAPSPPALGLDGALVVSTTSEDAHERPMLFLVGLSGGAPTPLFDTELDAVSYAPEGSGILVGRHTYDPVNAARWKGYRGGKHGFLWIDASGCGKFERIQLRCPTDPAEELNVSCPMWEGSRIWFVADPDGSANLWSANLDGTGLQKHSQHDFFDVRHARAGAGRIVYTVGGDLYIHSVAEGNAAPKRVSVTFGTPMCHLPMFLDAEEHCDDILLHPDGHHCAVLCRGQVFEMALWEGPAIPAKPAGPDPGRTIRCLTLEYLYSGRLVTVSDELLPALSFTVFPAPVPEESEEPMKVQDWINLFVADAGVGAAHVKLDTQIGSILDFMCSPAHDAVVATTNRNELWLLEFVPEVGDRPNPQTGPLLNTAVPLTIEAKLLDRSEQEEGLSEPCWSSDGEWLAYVRKDSRRGSSIVLLELASGKQHVLADSSFWNYGPCFSADGRFLTFFSARSFAPFDDEVTSEMTFACGSTLPYLVLLQQDGVNPFLRPVLSPAEMRDREDGGGDEEEEGGDDESGSEDGGEKSFEPPEQIKIDLEGITDRVLQFPLPFGRYSNGQWTEGGKFQYLRGTGVAHLPSMNGPDPDDSGPSALYAYNFQRLKEEKLGDNVQDFQLSMDLRNMIVRTQEPGPDGEEEWRVCVSGEKLPGEDEDAPEDADFDNPGPESGLLDIGSRVSLEILPFSEWTQIFDEARAHVAEMYFDDETGGTDWLATCARYRELLPRLRSRTELTDLISELFAELGVSHFSVSDPCDDGGDDDATGCGSSWLGSQGQLGARTTWQEINGTGAWRVEQVTKGDVWDAKYAGPLARPGVGISEGAFIIAVNRAKVSKDVSLEQMLANAGGTEVLITYVPQQFAAKFVQVQGLLEKSGGTDGLRRLIASHRRTDELKDVQHRNKSKKKGKKGKQEPEAEAEKKLAKMLADMSIDVSEGPIWRTARVRIVNMQTKRNALLRDLVQERSDFVHKATEGRVGYVHVPDTCEMGFAEFYRYYGRECERDALIIDVRCNGGGFAAELMLKQLRNQPMGFNVSRPGRGKLQVSPELSTPAHLVLLIDENTSSDGECWADAFRRFGMGKVVGVRTWGGVVSVGGADLETIDGGELSIPYQHYYAPVVGYGLENKGAEPDIEVPWTPKALGGGRLAVAGDPQLQEALRLVQEMLTKSPAATPEIPRFPKTRLHRLHQK